MRWFRVELKMSIAAFGTMDMKSHDTQEHRSDYARATFLFLKGKAGNNLPWDVL